jgi:uncharacterized protein YdeI (YjbR/CyaY-like superfamily)
MITDIDDYFSKGCGRCERFATAECSTKRWDSGLRDLRQLCLDAGLAETVKWGHPCYRHSDRNIVVLGAFRNDFRMSFFNAALMQDPEGLLEKQGPIPGPAKELCHQRKFSEEARDPLLTYRQVSRQDSRRQGRERTISRPGY